MYLLAVLAEDARRSPAVCSKSTLLSTLMCGSSICSIVRSDSSSSATYLDASVIWCASIRCTAASCTQQPRQLHNPSTAPSTHPPPSLLPQPLHNPLQAPMIRTQLHLPRRIKHHKRLLPPIPFPPTLLQHAIQFPLQPIHVRLEVLEAI